MAFYDRAATPFWAEVRRVLNQWFERYPAAEKAELRSRLWAGDVAGEAALWELLLHQLYHWKRAW